MGLFVVQSVFSSLLRGLEDDILKSSLGRWADTAATYCPGAFSQIVLKSMTKHRDFPYFFDYTAGQLGGRQKYDQIHYSLIPTGVPSEMVLIYGQSLSWSILPGQNHYPYCCSEVCFVFVDSFASFLSTKPPVGGALLSKHRSHMRWRRRRRTTRRGSAPSLASSDTYMFLLCSAITQ